MSSFVGHSKDLGFNSKCGGKSLESFNKKLICCDLPVTKKYFHNQVTTGNPPCP